jgi:hypothetical protein
MRELNEMLRDVERNRPPDLWSRIEQPRVDATTAVDPIRRHWPVLVVASLIGLAAVVFAWKAIGPLTGDEIADAGASILDAPPISKVAAANLADGRPVFVVHHEDGSLSVIDGISTHRPWGLAYAVTWCSSSRTFDDVYHGSKWTEDGVYMIGPAPTGLVTYETTVLGDGSVRVGSQLEPSPRGTHSDFKPTGPFCDGSGDTIDVSVPSDLFDSPSAAIEAAPDGWIVVQARLVATTPGEVFLCSIDPSQGSVCADHGPVVGVDPSRVEGMPESVVAGPFLARVQDGSFVDLTVVPRP